MKALFCIWILAVVLLVGGCRAMGLTPFGFALDGGKATVTVPEDAKAQLWTVVKRSNWSVTLAIPIIALGAVAAFNGMMKLGMSAIIFGSVNLFMGLATARFALWMAIFGLVGSAVAVVASILIKNRNLLEIVTGGQLFKKNSTPKEWRNFKKAQEEAQKSISTRTLVQNVKLKLKVLDPKIVITNGGQKDG